LEPPIAESANWKLSLAGSSKVLARSQDGARYEFPLNNRISEGPRFVERACPICVKKSYKQSSWWRDSGHGEDLFAQNFILRAEFAAKYQNATTSKFTLATVFRTILERVGQDSGLTIPGRQLKEAGIVSYLFHA
jgi:hypothetical protein